MQRSLSNWSVTDRVSDMNRECKVCVVCQGTCFFIVFFIQFKRLIKEMKSGFESSRELSHTLLVFLFLLNSICFSQSNSLLLFIDLFAFDFESVSEVESLPSPESVQCICVNTRYTRTWSEQIAFCQKYIVSKKDVDWVYEEWHDDDVKKNRHASWAKRCTKDNRTGGKQRENLCPRIKRERERDKTRKDR